MGLFKRKKHPFKVALESANQKYEEAANAMVALSDQVTEICGMSKEDIMDANLHDQVFSAGKYLIEPRCCCLPSGWKYVLMVVPKSTGGNVGWANVRHNPFPDGWTYYPKGTATVAVPYDPLIIENILEEVKNLA